MKIFYMTICFITGNKNKLLEAQTVIPELNQFEIDLPEIQDIDPHVIIKAKLNEALKHKKTGLIVEDTSLYLDCMNGLPGPLIKWFLKAIGNEGIYNMAKGLGNTSAKVKTIIGYAKTKNHIHFFEGVMKGKIVSPRGKIKFGWDPIFVPEGHDETYAEMNVGEKNKISMRKLAFLKLKKHLDGE